MKTLDVPIIVNEQYKKGIGETIEPLKELVTEYMLMKKTTFSGCQNSDILNAFKNLVKKKYCCCWNRDSCLCSSNLY